MFKDFITGKKGNMYLKEVEDDVFFIPRITRRN